MKPFFLFLLAFAVCGLVTNCKDKEEESGAIYGVVSDKATGEPIRSAGVELQPIGLKTVTGTDGQYGFADLELGTYKLYVTRTGNSKWLSDAIVVMSGQTVRYDVLLEW